jgi:NAD(P)-dependent dehydrogenase (short-subunit alcohol dehydrogenase family)
MSGRIEGKRVLVTQAADYMGPATAELFTAEGAQVTTDTSDLQSCRTMTGKLPSI